LVAFAGQFCENEDCMDDAKTQNPLRTHHEQMLKLVGKSFYNELINYGVDKSSILSVAGHLLDNVMQNAESRKKEGEYYNGLFTIKDVGDQWAAAKRLGLHKVTIMPLEAALVPKIAQWLRAPAVRDSFYPRFPESDAALKQALEADTREYFSIFHENDLAGFIGAENIDTESLHLEMRKLVGDAAMHGKGIGKRATFLFLYYVFVIRKFRKVYIHSFDINIRNLNINRKFGFELEGVFLEEAMIENKWRDVIRMALSGPVWLELFSQ
jgi:RimJ/RimL family protein N-acetyltransferase